jgi:hypothetical protein
MRRARSPEDREPHRAYAKSDQGSLEPERGEHARLHNVHAAASIAPGSEAKRRGPHPSWESSECDRAHIPHHHVWRRAADQWRDSRHHRGFAAGCDQIRSRAPGLLPRRRRRLAPDRHRDHVSAQVRRRNGRTRQSLLPWTVRRDRTAACRRWRGDLRLGGSRAYSSGRVQASRDPGGSFPLWTGRSEGASGRGRAPKGS